MKILIATDAYHPQINGVVTTLTNTAKILKEHGHEVIFLESSMFNVIPFRLYPDVDFIWNMWAVGKEIDKHQPDVIHIATEGPIGFAARLYCEKYQLNYTTSYHTKFPEYVKKLLPFLPIKIPYSYMRWFHNKARCILVTNEDMRQELMQWGFEEDRLRIWSRGADLQLFNPNQYTENIYDNLPRPILFYFGRVSKEKNIEDFCKVKTKGTKVIIGDGPLKKSLEQQHPEIVFTGMKTGQELAQYIASGDVFVFPSKWDTFGVVMIEANACNIPVAAFPVTGPKDYIKNGINGYIAENLEDAIEQCLTIPKTSPREYVEKNHTWEQCAHIFTEAVQPVDFYKQSLL